MSDPQWSLLKQCLLDRGWTARGDILYAPRETLWFTMNAEHPNLTAFRDQVTIASERVGAHAETDLDKADVREDLVSLVQALDDVLEN